MSIYHQMQRAEARKAALSKDIAKAETLKPQKPTAGQRLIKAAKQAREIAKDGPAPTGRAKKLISLRIDQDVIDAFRATGKGWQSRINDALAAFVSSR